MDEERIRYTPRIFLDRVLLRGNGLPSPPSLFHPHLMDSPIGEGIFSMQSEGRDRRLREDDVVGLSRMFGNRSMHLEERDPGAPFSILPFPFRVI